MRICNPGYNGYNIYWLKQLSSPGKVLYCWQAFQKIMFSSLNSFVRNSVNSLKQSELNFSSEPLDTPVTSEMWLYFTMQKILKINFFYCFHWLKKFHSTPPPSEKRVKNIPSEVRLMNLFILATINKDRWHSADLIFFFSNFQELI